MKRPDSRCVYILHNRELDRVKIGYANDPRSRWENIRNQSGCDIVLYYNTLPLTNYIQVEKGLHKTFATKRGIGEWFNIPPAAAKKELGNYEGEGAMCIITYLYLERSMNPTQISKEVQMSRSGVVKYLKGAGIYKKDRVEERKEGTYGGLTLEEIVARNNEKLGRKNNNHLKSRLQ